MSSSLSPLRQNLLLASFRNDERNINVLLLEVIAQGSQELIAALNILVLRLCPEAESLVAVLVLTYSKYYVKQLV